LFLQRAGYRIASLRELIHIGEINDSAYLFYALTTVYEGLAINAEITAPMGSTPLPTLPSATNRLNANLGLCCRREYRLCAAKSGRSGEPAVTDFRLTFIRGEPTGAGL
jgi:hypothetical protein